MPSRYRLSKSRFTAGLQCHKLLWWKVHEPDAPELVPSPAQRAIFDQGTRVGEVARTYVPGGVLVDAPHNAFAQRLAMTKRLLDQRVPAIYEASFNAGDVYAAVDILQRDGDRLRLIEVKSSTRLKDEHFPDVAIQLHVLRAGGVDVASAELMHLNRQCAYPDLEDLFVREDVTDAAEALQPGLPELIAGQLRMLAGGLPDVPIGEHCTKPYECPFIGRCWADVPEHHVSTLYRAPHGAAALIAQGFETIAELPPGGLTAIQARQRQAVLTGRLIVEPGLAHALRVFEGPLAFLDFETVGLAIPVWEGCHPYDQVPVQFSCHRPAPDGTIAHHEWLADGPGDPRPELARALVAACAGARTVVAYNAHFERGCIERLADAVPELADDLLAIAGRLADPLPIVRAHVYHPDFHGSFSLKSVLPALVPSNPTDTGRDLAPNIAFPPQSEVGAGLVPARAGNGDVPPDSRAAARAAPTEFDDRAPGGRASHSASVGRAPRPPGDPGPYDPNAGPDPVPTVEPPASEDLCHSEAQRAEDPPRAATPPVATLASPASADVGAGLAPNIALPPQSDVGAGLAPARAGVASAADSGTTNQSPPNSPYADLEIAEGATAAVELERLLFRGDTMTAADKRHLRDALLRYCAVDTMSMVRLLERLRELA